MSTVAKDLDDCKNDDDKNDKRRMNHCEKTAKVPNAMPIRTPTPLRRKIRTTDEHAPTIFGRLRRDDGEHRRSKEVAESIVAL